MGFSGSSVSAKDRGWREILRELKDHDKYSRIGLTVSAPRVEELNAMRRESRAKQAKVRQGLRYLDEDIARGQYVPEDLPQLQKRRKDLAEAEGALRKSEYLFQPEPKAPRQQIKVSTALYIHPEGKRALASSFGIFEHPRYKWHVPVINLGLVYDAANPKSRTNIRDLFPGLWKETAKDLGLQYVKRGLDPSAISSAAIYNRMQGILMSSGQGNLGRGLGETNGRLIQGIARD